MLSFQCRSCRILDFALSAATSDPTNRRGMLSGAVYKKAAAMQRLSDRSQPNKRQILG
jgi:hypothetical protein